jgi:hypothetical protein
MDVWASPSPQQVTMAGDDLCLAVYGLKSCSGAHPEVALLLLALRRKAHAVFAKPTQPWDDYERLLAARHAGMLPEVLAGRSRPAFSAHSLATALEGVRGLSRALCRGGGRGGEEARRSLEKVQELQATLITKLQYTDAPFNLTHLSLFLNALRYIYIIYTHSRSLLVQFCD